MINTDLSDQFLELVEENKKLIYKVTHLFCGDCNDKGDLFQEIIVNLWKAYPDFKGNSKVSTWVYRISINTAVSWVRINSKNNQWIEYRSVIPQLEDDTGMNELQERLYSAISSLSKLDKALVMLQLEGYSYDEIAKIIGLSKTNVATRLNRIKQKLKDHFSNN